MKLSNFNLGPGLFIIGYHLLLLVGLPFYFIYGTMPPWSMIVISFILMYVTGLSTTAGYHRLFSHKTYKAHPVVESFLLFFATMGTQGSALRWAFEHREHHAYVDTDRDPYSIKKGFWYAHFLWLFEKPKPIEEKVVSDLMRNPLLRFQDRFYPYLMIATNVLAFGVVGYFYSDYLGAFVFAWLLRMFFLHHFTWLINSLAHTWGARHFCQELSAVDNYCIALLTFGEGYHNYHHTFAYDYRNGIKWYHFDPTKWLIWILHKCRLVTKLKTVPDYCVQEKMVLDRKQLLLEAIGDSLVPSKEKWEERVNKVADNLLNKLHQLRQLSSDYQGLKASSNGKREYLHELEDRLKEIRLSLRLDGRQWLALSQKVLKRQALA